MTFKTKYKLRFFYYIFDYLYDGLLYMELFYIMILCIINFFIHDNLTFSFYINDTVNHLTFPIIFFVIPFLTLLIISKININKYKNIDNYNKMTCEDNGIIYLTHCVLNSFTIVIYEDGFYHHFIHDRLIHKTKSILKKDLAKYFSIDTLDDLEKFPIYKTRTQVQENRDIKINKLLESNN